jgi:predicted transcriptional regulator of viral defense system
LNSLFDMRNVDLFKQLRLLGKSYYTAINIQDITGLSKKSAYDTLERLAEQELLVKVKAGIYVPAFIEPDLEKIANEIYYPSYVSFDTALQRRGVSDQIPYTITMATTKPPKKIILGGREVMYRRLKKELFFGYTLEKGVYIAEAEKAVLDQLYMISKGLNYNSSKEWDLSGLRKGVLRQYAKRYPKAVALLLKELL